MKILEANKRESSAFTGTEYFPFSDSADSTDGRICVSDLQTYIADDITAVSDDSIESIFN